MRENDYRIEVQIPGDITCAAPSFQVITKHAKKSACKYLDFFIFLFFAICLLLSRLLFIFLSLSKLLLIYIFFQLLLPTITLPDPHDPGLEGICPLK